MGTGIGGGDLGSTAPTAVGTYTVLATFTGSTDYASASASRSFSIRQATPTVTVTDNGGTYNGSPFSASATMTGVSGTKTGTLEGVSPTYEYYSGTGTGGTDLGSTAPSAAGTYTVVASFAGSTDYTSATLPRPSLSLKLRPRRCSPPRPIPPCPASPWSSPPP